MLKDASYRRTSDAARADFKRFITELGGEGLRAPVHPVGERKTALILRSITLRYAKVEGILAKALQMAGFEALAVGNRSYDFLRYDWLVGDDAGYMPADFGADGDPDWVACQMPQLNCTRDWLDLRYRGVRVGQFVLALELRWRRTGKLDFSDPETRTSLAAHLNRSVGCAIGAFRMLDEIKPDLLLFMDRGYAGFGEVFDVAMLKGVDCLTWNLGHKSNRLVLKRYSAGNERDHPFGPSAQAWDRMCTRPWEPSLGDAIRQELFGAYNNQDWFGVVGTQFGKQMLSKERVRAELGLSEDKKVAVIFPHILWDGSFFYGADLFEDYTEWFVETIKAACANDRVQWVVKLHPAHMTKAAQEGLDSKPAELTVLEGVVDSLPPHIKLVSPETPISTYSMFEVADYVVTVRGTVGIEAALFGVPVITAGTGRYDRRGFTVDSTTQEEYLSRLATLETLPPLSRKQVELAERYAYYVFLCKPLQLTCASLEWARDAQATPLVSIHCQTPEQWLSSPDMTALAAWMKNGTIEDFVGAPLPIVKQESAEHAVVQ